MKKLILLSSFLMTFLLNGCGGNSADEVIDPQSAKGCYRMKQLSATTTIPSDRRVSVLFQVLSCNNNTSGVSGLKSGDFQVFENSGSIDSESLASFDPKQVPFSMRTLLLLDVSSSVLNQIPQIKEACKALIEQKLPDQSFAIYIFDKNTRRLRDFTTSKDELLMAIEQIPTKDLENSTNLYGAIMTTAKLVPSKYTATEISDGSLIIFTDGRHNADPGLTLENARAAVRGVNTYVAALKSSDLQEDPLKQIAASGENGGYFIADKVDVLKEQFLNIQKRISNWASSYYLLNYRSPISNPQNRTNTLEIRIKGNTNRGADKSISTTFNSFGFK
ncbi:MAG: VWA domain-containing protein [Spirosomaceae bacterium]|jgi:hypothetical protein|nr:VWA domain-containing protein [Spirosomataceae bacterium]